jgi:hypothetical protein
MIRTPLAPVLHRKGAASPEAKDRGYSGALRERGADFPEWRGTFCTARRTAPAKMARRGMRASCPDRRG